MLTTAKLKKSAQKPTKWPEVGRSHEGMVTLLGIVFLAMAITQLLTFNKFEIILYVGGLTAKTAWAVAIILAEILAAAGFFKIRISHLLRVLSAVAALSVSIFWFVYNIKLIADGLAGIVPNIGFFGDYLAQTPGWWTTLMTTVLVLWVIYALDLMRSSLSLGKA